MAKAPLIFFGNVEIVLSFEMSHFVVDLITQVHFGRIVDFFMHLILNEVVFDLIISRNELL